MRCGSGSASAANEWVGLPLFGIRIAAILASRAAPTGTGRAGRPAGVAQATPRSLRLEAQDVALSRLHHGFESRQESPIIIGHDATAPTGAAIPTARPTPTTPPIPPKRGH